MRILDDSQDLLDHFTTADHKLEYDSGHRLVPDSHLDTHCDTVSVLPNHRGGVIDHKCYDAGRK